MNCDVTVKASDFSKIHNALWSLQYNKGNVIEQVELIREALKDAYEQEEADFERKSNHYHQVSEELGLSAIWSIHEVNNLSDTHTYEGVETVTYKDHWGETEDGEDIGTVVVPINGNTWASLYVAANAAISASGDAHHIFIEDFKQVGNTLVLATGS
jgi:hypothetical protein